MVFLWFEIFVIAVPQVEFFADFPALDVGSALQPGNYSLQSLFAMLLQTQFDDDIKHVFAATATAAAVICFDRFLYESIKKFIKMIAAVAVNDDLATPFCEFPDMFLFAHSLFHNAFNAPIASFQINWGLPCLSRLLPQKISPGATTPNGTLCMPSAFKSRP